ncbi:MAG: lipoate--protein ligase family protein [Ignavibacteriales bacterium]|nr:lipoate--protein ligase family protein [Ignavibacteriales bacterium]
MKWQFLNSGVNSGKFNMDFDVFLSENFNPNNAILRLYRWNPYCISLGANQSLEDIDFAKTRYHQIDVVKRPTGGRAILHSQELTYSVIYPIGASSSAKNIYNEINLALRKGLINFDSRLDAIDLENTQPDFKEFYKSEISSICFAVSAKSELNLKGKKIVGSAQRKLGNVILQHGSILCGAYHKKIVDYLNVTDELRKAMFQEIASTTIDLKSALNTEIDYAKLNASILNGFKEHFNSDFEEIDHEFLESKMIA